MKPAENSTEKMLFLEQESPFGFAETVEKLNIAITENQWKVLHSHDLQQVLKNREIDVLPVIVLELCNPFFSSQLLKNDNERINSTMMPCRISVYEKSNGQTYISRMNAKLLSKQIGGLTEKVMSEAFDATEKIITSSLINI